MINDTKELQDLFRQTTFVEDDEIRWDDMRGRDYDFIQKLVRLCKEDKLKVKWTLKT